MRVLETGELEVSLPIVNLAGTIPAAKSTSLNVNEVIQILFKVISVTDIVDIVIYIFKLLERITLRDKLN